mmetsp:Transcript_6798/g.18798  ORF Transcript_6798/g.18798 Transcript_6798/m.18798 type:complete len:232 (+) Transcript_6798:442-1137(+)
MRPCLRWRYNGSRKQRRPPLPRFAKARMLLAARHPRVTSATAAAAPGVASATPTTAAAPAQQVAPTAVTWMVRTKMTLATETRRKTTSQTLRRTLGLSMRRARLTRLTKAALLKGSMAPSPVEIKQRTRSQRSPRPGCRLGAAPPPEERSGRQARVQGVEGSSAHLGPVRGAVPEAQAPVTAPWPAAPRGAAAAGNPAGQWRGSSPSIACSPCSPHSEGGSSNSCCVVAAT